MGSALGKVAGALFGGVIQPFQNPRPRPQDLPTPQLPQQQKKVLNPLDNPELAKEQAAAAEAGTTQLSIPLVVPSFSAP